MRYGRLVLLLIAGVAVLLAASRRPAWAGSQFYFTVERSFSSDESPELRLDYTKTNEPITLRVLRPKDLSRFLQGQLNLSRAYEEPLASINPGHFVLDGVNALKSPLHVLRNSLSEDFRRSFGGDDFNYALHDPAPVKPVSVPNSVINGPPTGFELVRETYLDLQRGGAETENASWFWGEDERYRIRSVRLDPLPDGVYLLQGLQGKVEAQALLQVSSLSVQVKQSSSQLIVRVIDRKLAPVAGARASYRDSRGSWKDIPGATNEFGELSFQNPEGVLEGKLVLRVDGGNGRSALAETDFLPASTVENSVFLVTDRPIFKPGEEFFYKGTLRILDGGELRLPHVANPKAEVTLVRSDGEATDLTAVVPVTEFGTFSGSFQMPSYQAPGLYRLVAKVDEKIYGGEFRVKDYVKPKFYLEISDKSPSVVPGEKLSFRIKAKNFSGSIPEGVKYETFIYRKKFEAPQFVLEGGGGLEAGHDYFGEIRSATALSQPQRIYSSAEARSASAGEAPPDGSSSWRSAPELDESGEAAVEIDVPKPGKPELPAEWIYTLIVRAQDVSGSAAVASENFYATLSEVTPTVKFRDPAVEAGAGELAFAVRVTYPDGTPAANAKGKVTLTLDTPKGGKKALGEPAYLTDESGIARLKAPAVAEPGRVRAVGVVDRLGDRALAHPGASEPAFIFIGSQSGEAIVANRELELIPESTIVSPGERTKILALLPENWGSGESGIVWHTDAGTKVFGTTSVALKGRSVWLDVEAKPEYGTGFFHTVTVPLKNGKFSEQTVGYRIVPDDKRLAIRVVPSSETAEPLKDFYVSFEVQDNDGKPAAGTELSVNVVDKAVYAVQPEFRPDILEFFYPLPRLNLGTFYSDELQGYGYADEIRQPNFSLAAIKTRSQPAKRSMRDTAGWFPHVVTDSDGRATVKIAMPANITEWIVTAIAADKAGRVGEGRGRFRSSSDINIDAEFPLFLREGDEAAASIQAENTTAKEIELELTPSATGEVTLASGAAAQSAKIPPRERSRIPVRFLADGSAEQGLVRVDLQTAEAVRTGGPREFDLALMPRVIEQLFSGTWNKTDRTVRFPAPEAGELSRATFTVTSGLLAAALGAARELVSYPYGCTEQLAHTTIPNLILLDLLEKAELDKERIKAFRLSETADRAKQLAESGVRRLVMNQKADGGFGLWSGDREANFPLTLVVLRALSLANELNVGGASNAFYSGRAWVASQISASPPDMRAPLAGFQLSILTELGFLYQLQNQMVEFVSVVAGDPDAPLENIISALQILKRIKGQWWITEAMKTEENTAALLGRLEGKLKHFDEEAYYQRVSSDFDALGFGFARPALVSAALGILHAFDKLTPEHRKRYEALLAADMKNGIWTSTFETGQVIFNTRDLLAEEVNRMKSEAAAGRRVSVKRSDGRLLAELLPTAGGFTVEMNADPKRVPEPLAGLRSVAFDGVKPDEVVIAKLEGAVPFSAVKSQASGLDVSRRLLKITPTGTLELYPGELLHVGDVVISEVSVTRGGAKWRDGLASRFVAVEDGIPGIGIGVEDDRPYIADAKLIEDAPSFWAKVKDTQRRPEKVTRIVELAPGGSMKLYNVWRTAFSGKAALPPARAFDMYNDALAGNTVAGEIRAE